jgi:hypothetical protein
VTAADSSAFYANDLLALISGRTKRSHSDIIIQFAGALEFVLNAFALLFGGSINIAAAAEVKNTHTPSKIRNENNTCAHLELFFYCALFDTTQQAHIEQTCVQPLSLFATL